MVATLLWGGCISCPQFFMFPTDKAERNCCKKNGECDRPTKTDTAKECKRMPLEPQEVSSAHAELAVPVVVASAVIIPLVLEVSATAPHPEAPILEHSPPDLNVLNSTFII
jgi:hypothetical protein